MGLTYPSLDYVITMDSEFDNEFVDGGQLIRKVGLGVNALYQRIGRCGRNRPGIAFIAKDFGADYTDKTDQELAAGLKEAPVKYPLAKGNFQKLALYSFRENIQESQLRNTIKDLKLPSKIHESNHLWKKFLLERERLKKIGIASGDSLTPAGKKSLSFIGLDDMYFSRLLSESIERYGTESNITLFFVLLAASSEIPFNMIILRDFVLENPLMLSSYQIIDNDVLGSDIEAVRKSIIDNVGDEEKVYDKLSQLNVSNVVANKICSLLRDGYTLKDKKEEQEIEDEENINVEEIQEEELEDDGEENEQKESFLKMMQQKDEDVLSFEKTLIPLHGTSELINVWRLFYYFFNKYFTYLRTNKYSNIESIAFKNKMESDFSKMQISFSAMNDLNKRFFDLCKHIKIKLPKVESNLSDEIQLSKEENEILLESCIRELLNERVENNDDYDVCLQLYKLMEKTNEPNFKEISQKLNQKDINMSSDEVRKWWFLIIRESKKKMKEYLDMLIEKREILPILTSQEEDEVLSLLNEFGYHHKLLLKKNGPRYLAKFTDSQGEIFDIILDVSNNPLQVGFNEKDFIDIYAKLTPRLVKSDEKISDQSAANLKDEEKLTYQISHLTITM